MHTNLLNAAHFYPVERMGLPRVLVRKETLEAFKRAQSSANPYITVTTDVTAEHLPV